MQVTKMTPSEIKTKYKASRARAKKLIAQLEDELVTQKRLEWTAALHKLKRWFLL